MTQRAFVIHVTVATVLFAVLVGLGHPPAPDAPAPARQPVLERLARYGRGAGLSRWSERSGRPVSAGDLRGRVWIADFIYTKCEDNLSRSRAAPWPRCRPT